MDSGDETTKNNPLESLFENLIFGIRRNLYFC